QNRSLVSISRGFRMGDIYPDTGAWALRWFKYSATA
ncbi:MAG: hypothetical protein ACI89U_000734, partial [Gammaproteobacteria bacterium]